MRKLLFSLSIVMGGFFLLTPNTAFADNHEGAAEEAPAAEAPAPEEAAPAEEPAAMAEGEKSDGGTDWSWSARMRPRGEVFVNQNFGLDPGVLNYARHDEVDIVSQQTRLAVTATRGEVSGHIQLQHVAAWGQYGGNLLTDGPIAVHQAYLNVDGDALDLRIGRQELAYGSQRVLGTDGWHQIGRAWDAAKASVALPGDVALDLFAGQYAEGAAGAGITDGYEGNLSDEDAYLLGAYATITSVPGLSLVDLYVLHDRQLEAPNHNIQARRALTTAGLRLTGSWSVVDLEVESAFQTGDEESRMRFEERAIAWQTLGQINGP
jgi:hypothetical protein